MQPISVCECGKPIAKCLTAGTDCKFIVKGMDDGRKYGRLRQAKV